MNNARTAAVAAALTLTSCVAAVQDEFNREAADAASETRAVAIAPLPAPAARRARVASARDQDAGSLRDDSEATEAIVWHAAAEAAGDALGHAWQGAPQLLVSQVAQFTTSAESAVERLGCNVDQQLQTLANPPLHAQMRWLPVLDGKVFLEGVDAAKAELAATGKLRWSKRPHFDRYGEMEPDAYWSVTRAVAMDNLPAGLRDLAGHPLVPADNSQPHCTAEIVGLQMVSWLHPYNQGDAPQDGRRQRQWTWQNGEKHLVAELRLQGACTQAAIEGWRSARLPATHTLDELALTPQQESAWFAKLVPHLATLNSYRDSQTAFDEFVHRCAAAASAQPECAGAEAGQPWFTYRSTESASEDAGHLSAVHLRAYRDGKELWIAVQIDTPFETCGGDFYGSHRSLWHARGTLTHPQRAVILGGSDGGEGSAMDIDNDGAPDVVPQVQTPQEFVCPC